MRRLILKMQMSLDGFVGKADGDVGFIFTSFDDALTAWIVAGLWEAGLHIMGRKTYGDMAAHWPTSTEPYAPPMNQIPKAVFSGSLTQAPWSETEIIGGDLATEIARLKAQPGKDILAHGGAGFARALITANLIDEYRLVTHPVVLGRGLPIFSDIAAARDLELLESRSFPKGAIANVYRPVTRGDSRAQRLAKARS
jgi:dihydrofolate reductase